MATTDSRSTIVAWGNYFAGKVHDFIYSEAGNRMEALGKFPVTFPVFADCSSWLTLCFWLAGAADPNGGTAYQGNNFGREGYTGTLVEHGTHIPASAVVAGDVVVYGVTPAVPAGVHTALIVQIVGKDILTVSNGGPTGESPTYCWVNHPAANPHNYPVDGREPQTFLRFATATVGTLHTPPTA
jgi:hypothetical protein